MKLIHKDWGYELELVNNEKYCAKFLFLRPGWQCSLHRHRDKDETFTVLDGEMELELGADLGFERNMHCGDSQRIDPGLYHRFSNHTDHTCLILEVSTHHSDEDVERLEPSQRIPTGP